jgi:hypothetical protein
VHIWEAAFGNTLAKVPANSAKRRACAGVQSNPLERCNTCRHQTLATWFFSGKTPTFEQLDGKANSSELDRRCRTCQTSAGDQDIGQCVHATSIVVLGPLRDALGAKV